MKQILAAACIFGFLALAATAYVLTEQESALDAVFDNKMKSVAEDAVHVGEILCDVAGQLAEDEDLTAEADEYFIGVLWSKAKSTVRNATAKLTGAVKNAYNETKEHLKAAKEEAKRRVTEKAMEIMAKIFSKFMDSYALGDSNSRMSIAKAVSTIIERVGLRLKEQGMYLLES
uniref:Putative secreted protein n=1 Tax=Amblyomma triste TaxID=251400 RepID=A0A023G8Z0_AMBTT